MYLSSGLNAPVHPPGLAMDGLACKSFRAGYRVNGFFKEGSVTLAFVVLETIAAEATSLKGSVTPG